MSESDAKYFMASLRQAVAALPTTAASCTLPAPLLEHSGLSDDPAKAASYAAAFGAWAQQAIDELGDVCCDHLEATDFNDYYKLVMSRVEFLYARARVQPEQPGQPGQTEAQQHGQPETPRGLQHAPPIASPICCFQTQLRRRPTFTPASAASTGAASTGAVSEQTLGIFDRLASSDRVGSFDDISVRFRAALSTVGARRFHAATLRRLISLSGDASMEAALEAVNDSWIEALDGRRLFDLLPDGDDFSSSPSCVSFSH